MTSLRREAEALLLELGFLYATQLATDRVEAFAKAQRVKEVEAINKFCVEWLAMAEADKLDAEQSGLYNMFQGRVQVLANFRDWLSQRKKELAP